MKPPTINYMTNDDPCRGPCQRIRLSLAQIVPVTAHYKQRTGQSSQWVIRHASEAPSFSSRAARPRNRLIPDNGGSPLPWCSDPERQSGCTSKVNLLPGSAVADTGECRGLLCVCPRSFAYILEQRLAGQGSIHITHSHTALSQACSRWRPNLPCPAHCAPRAPHRRAKGRQQGRAWSRV